MLGTPGTEPRDERRAVTDGQRRARRIPRPRLLRRNVPILAFLAVLGPGLITGAADNDAQGITTYAQAGAQTGNRLLWLLLFSAIALVVTQEIGARLGMSTGKGLAALIRERFGVRPAATAMLLLLIANLGTIASEFAGIAAALGIFHVSRFVAVPIAAAAVFVLVTRGSYKRVELVFLVLSASLLSYVISGVMAHPDWGQAMHGTFVPTFHLSSLYIVTAVGLVGTTVAPWGQFFIQAYVVDKGLGIDDLAYERGDVAMGSTVTLVVGFFIIVATAQAFPFGRTLENASQAALALRPLAGSAAEILFAVGLVNASLLAAAVLPLSTSYAVCEALGFEMGLDRRMREAPVFYGIVGFSIVFGAALVMLAPGRDLIPILTISAAVNGVLLAPMLGYILLLANDRELMGEHRNGRLANALMLLTIVVLLVLTVALFVFTFGG